jgi:phosphatidylethanolamine-binding protein (PEBP) family uncharacterized protein
MRQPPKPMLATVLMLGLALSGCGSAGSSATKVVRIPFTSTALVGNKIPARYTCDGQDIPPSLEWGAVPADTGELVLFVLGFIREPDSTRYAISVDWAVAGINPALHRLGSGELPHGVNIGLSESGKRRYSICPPKGTTEQYQFELYGMPTGTAVPSHFVGAQALGSLNIGSTSSPVIAHGAFVALYTRKPSHSRG